MKSRRILFSLILPAAVFAAAVGMIAGSAGRAERTAVPQGSGPPACAPENRAAVETAGSLFQMKLSADLGLLEGMKNNSCDFVEYEGEVYYRQYCAESYEEGAAFANYEARPGVETKMMCIGEDGSVRELFSDRGTGGFYIQDGRMYLTERGGEGDSVRQSIYSVRLDGGGRREYGEGVILAADRERHFVICDKNPDGRELALYRIDTLTGGQERITAVGPDSHFLKLEDGAVYYGEYGNGVEISENTYTHPETLCSLSLTDGRKKVLASVCEANEFWLELRNVEILEDRAYFTYGGGAGSGGYYTKGLIGEAMLDGSGFRIFDDGYREGELVINEEFYVIDRPQGPLLIFNDCNEAIGIRMAALDPPNGTVSGTDFLPEAVKGPGALFYGSPDGMEDGIYVFPDNSGTLVPVMSPFYDRLPDGVLDHFSMSFVPEKLAFIDGFLYCEAVGSNYDEDYSVGWRDGYRRAETVVFRYHVLTETFQLLYKY